ncbi:MAG: ammonium transporter [Methylovirgula sp.]
MRRVVRGNSVNSGENPSRRPERHLKAAICLSGSTLPKICAVQLAGAFLRLSAVLRKPADLLVQPKRAVSGPLLVRNLLNRTADGFGLRCPGLGRTAVGSNGGGSHMLIPSPKWLDTGSNAWQLAAATFVALQSVPGLVVLYGGLVKKKWAINSAFMAMYAFAAVMIVWVLWAYNMAFGPQWFPFLGHPGPATAALFETGEAIVPAAASGMPPLAFPMATMTYFQFVFAAITVIILGGSLLGRMSFKAWVIFCPLWMTFIYTVGCFSLWGGGWLASMGAVDFSGGYVIHLAAATSGFVAAAVVGPRLQRDIDHFPPNSLLMALVGAGILWLGWNGFNGGDPYFANADAAAAVLNTNIATAAALLVWTLLDSMAYGKPSVVGAINGMIAGLVAITPGAGFVNGYGAIIIGVCAGIIPWLSMNKLQKTALMSKVDDVLSVFSTHGVAGLMGGLLVGVLADPNMLVYIGTDKDAPGVSVTGSAHQLLLQFYAAAFIIVFNAVGTFIILKIISIFVSLRMPESMLLIGDDAVHGEEAYALDGDGQRVAPGAPAE